MSRSKTVCLAGILALVAGSLAPVSVTLSVALALLPLLLLVVLSSARAVIHLYLVAAVCGVGLSTDGPAANVYDLAAALILVAALVKVKGPVDRRLLVLFTLFAVTSLSLPMVFFTQPELLPESTFRALRTLSPAVAALVLWHEYREAPIDDLYRLTRFVVRVLLAGAVFGIIDFAVTFPVPWARAEQFIYLAGGMRYRAMGFIGESSGFANLCLLGLCVALYAPSDVLDRRGRTVSAAVFSLAILLSLSRTALLLTAILLLVAIMRVPQARRVGVALIVASVGAIFAIGSLREGIAFRIQQTFAGDNLASTTSGRSDYWQEVLRRSDEPIYWIFGHGYKTIAYSDVVFQSQGFVDNNYLSAFFETGVVGLVGIVAAGVYMFRALAGDRELVGRPMRIWLVLTAIAMTTGDVLTYFHTLGAWFPIYAIAIVASSKAAAVRFVDDRQERPLRMYASTRELTPP